LGFSCSLGDKRRGDKVGEKEGKQLNIVKESILQQILEGKSLATQGNFVWTTSVQ
jgi:hypothetical protein